MKTMRPFTLMLATALALACPQITTAATWTGGTANWSSNASPGWNGTGVPNAVGDVAAFSTSGTTTQDISTGVTVGTVSMGGSGNVNRTITLTNAITLNQDGASSGSATISNTNNSGTNGGTITLGAGTLTLADNLLISNTGNSTNTTGAIQISSTVGGTGNITISNDLNDTTNFTGAIRLTGANTFTGTVAISKGLVTFATNASAFGGVAGNTITLGSSGQNATLVSTAVTAAVANNWQVASSAGTVVLGSASTASSGTQNYTGTGVLNSNLSLRSTMTGTGRVELSGVVSGTGGITKIGSGQARLSNANTYSGDTLVSAGTLEITNNLALQNSAFDTSGPGTLILNATTTPTFGGLKGSTNLPAAISSGYSSVTALTLNTVTGANHVYSGVISNGAANMTLTKAGAGTQVLANDNSYSGATTISGGTLQIGNGGTTGSLLSTSGVTNNATLSYNRSNALTVGYAINGTGAVRQDGAGTTTLTGTSGYTGATTVNAGTLRINGSLTGTSGVTVNNNATFGGTGTVNSAVTFNAGSTASPGASVQSISTGALTLNNNSTFEFELDSSAALASAADLWVANGNLSLGSPVALTITDLAGAPTAFALNTTFSIINYAGAWNSGLFTYNSNVLNNNDTFTAGLNTWQITYNATSGGLNFTGDQITGNFVNITAVPEPGAAMLLLAGLSALAMRRRRA